MQCYARLRGRLLQFERLVEIFHSLPTQQVCQAQPEPAQLCLGPVVVNPQVEMVQLWVVDEADKSLLVDRVAAPLDYPGLPHLLPARHAHLNHRVWLGGPPGPSQGELLAAVDVQEEDGGGQFPAVGLLQPLVVVLPVAAHLKPLGPR